MAYRVGNSLKRPLNPRGPFFECVFHVTLTNYYTVSAFYTELNLRDKGNVIPKNCKPQRSQRGEAKPKNSTQTTQIKQIYIDFNAL